MIPIYIIIASLSVSVAVAIAIAFDWRRTAKKLLACVRTTENAYSELTAQSSLREGCLREEVRRLNHSDTMQVEALQKTSVRLLEVQADADRLAPIVEQFIKDIDDTARLLKDDKPPALAVEREAIRLHQELLKSRTI